MAMAPGLKAVKDDRRTCEGPPWIVELVARHASKNRTYLGEDGRIVDRLDWASWFPSKGEAWLAYGILPDDSRARRLFRSRILSLQEAY